MTFPLLSNKLNLKEDQQKQHTEKQYFKILITLKYSFIKKPFKPPARGLKLRKHLTEIGIPVPSSFRGVDGMKVSKTESR